MWGYDQEALARLAGRVSGAIEARDGLSSSLGHIWIKIFQESPQDVSYFCVCLILRWFVTHWEQSYAQISLHIYAYQGINFFFNFFFRFLWIVLSVLLLTVLKLLLSMNTTIALLSVSVLSSYLLLKI